MSCSGLHCAGCAGGASVPPVAFAALLGLPWVIEHAVEVAVTSGVCAVLAVAAVVALVRWGDRRQAARVAAHPLVVTRDVQYGVQSGPADNPQLNTTERPAIVYRDLHIHLDGVPDTGQAEVIRRAIGGNQAGGD